MALVALVAAVALVAFDDLMWGLGLSRVRVTHTTTITYKKRNHTRYICKIKQFRPGGSNRKSGNWCVDSKQRRKMYNLQPLARAEDVCIQLCISIASSREGDGRRGADDKSKAVK